MANAYVRVELHGATSVAQYERLHRAMDAIGFQRTIRAGNGTIYDLPTASYYSERFATIESARDAAWKASAGITAYHAVIAAGTAIAWERLTPRRA